MMLDLFGSGMPLAARFFIAFLVVLALIGVTAWLVRRFAANRLGNTAARGRQPRLAVIDSANVDARRQLVLIRRDNVEHLLMIGGPTDVVIEPNIVRAAATREPLRAGAPDIVARPAPALETGWPLQPLTEPPAAAPPTSLPPLAPTPVRPSRSNVTEEPWLAPEPGARPRPAEGFGSAPDLAPPPPLRSEPPAPRVSVPPPTPAPALAPEPPPVPSAAQTDHNLAEMALQLEAALRRAPLPESRPPVSDAIAAQAAAPVLKPPRMPEPPPRAPLRDFKPRTEPRLEPKPEVKPEPKFEPKVEAKPELKAEPKPEPKVEAKPDPKLEPKLEAWPKPEPKVEVKPEPAAASDRRAFDSLEAEMASLLGRPSGKS